MSEDAGTDVSGSDCERINMFQFYQKNKVYFAIIWIVAYCVIIGSVRGSYGDDHPFMCLSLAAFAAVILYFVLRNRLQNRFGLDHWPKDTKRYLYFLPMWILSTGNLWAGFNLNYKGIHQLYAMITMALVGFVEEMIFRCFLFDGMKEEGKLSIAIIISSLTFGMGHIVNLFTGQDVVQTLVQICFAVAWGFIFTMVYHKCESILPCIIGHSLIDVFSTLANDSALIDQIYVISTIVLSILYCIYLSKLKTEKE